ncbi:MAG: argininosuccinate synthase [Candidatus Pacebacteria bacterium CG10_big_fil_rev_8_21_14_0_10_36_11]|nr:argininosuccinate synthase [Candidatus Pacearchaeota archaeon]OIP73667.1 MAG: argininosuccinate synthase [Candidatus Pacebacteria bacterium CG2_30_36_39]PIR64751.1 MAG: argininosuccinate synthase [Candidatus Pacebacteria bacterium CG10_big_fil_rev_8_21_14_0_10_36_11]PJC43057.1 MAG: argininosuccinate synthase [Candidatus Pacebacteria bacterium CG_4_9_14_0_2_um_filter_36_8]
MKQETPYTKVSSYEGRKGSVKKVALLYSGGLDTSVMLKWIQEEYEAEVVALTVDIGQQADDLEKIKEKAIKLGAVKAIVIDAKKEFAYHYIAKGIKANASYQGKYHLSTPLGRPLLAKIAVEIAREEGCDTIAHGCTGKGNDQVRIEGTVLTLAPEMKIIAPVREWSMGRDEEIEYAKKHKIPVKQTAARPYSYDDNMWGVTAESGEIENPALIPPLDKILQVCTIVERTPNKPEFIKIEFVRGIPVKIDGKTMNLVDIIDYLNKAGAKHGVGVTHHIEDRLVGLKVRGIYEAPAAEIIINAHMNLEKYVCTRRENEFKHDVDNKWAYLCYGALWYEPLMSSLNAFIDHINDKVTGTTTVKLYKGMAETVAVETANSIFDEKLATFMKNDTYNQNASPGFIEIYTLQMRLAQNKARFALLTIGEIEDKKAFLPYVKILAELGYNFYATENTHKFYKKHGIESVFINKMQDNVFPNLEEMLQQNLFDLIINVPYKNKPENSKDENVIRKWAVKHSIPIVGDKKTFEVLTNKLRKHIVTAKTKK